MIEFLEALLVRCEELAEGRDWAQVAVGARDVLDAIRSAVATDAPSIAVFDFAAGTVHDHLTAVLTRFDDVDALVGAVACARAVDDIWGDDLAAEGRVLGVAGLQDRAGRHRHVRGQRSHR